ncbi:MAG: hypothetical protein M0009_10770 [Deltaproteobacteria bacterium]|nr:hypothetical protein [Deltaproteobacteria bacterium]
MVSAGRKRLVTVLLIAVLCIAGLGLTDSAEAQKEVCVSLIAGTGFVGQIYVPLWLLRSDKSYTSNTAESDWFPALQTRCVALPVPPPEELKRNWLKVSHFQVVLTTYLAKKQVKCLDNTPYTDDQTTMKFHAWGPDWDPKCVRVP